MAQQARLTKDQRREMAREMARAEREKRQKAQARNRILVRVGATVGVLALLGGVAGGIWLATRPAGPGPANMASDGILFTGSGDEIKHVATPGIPDGDDPVATDPSNYAAPLHIVSYIDFGCPYCQQFELANAEQIQELVASGQATYEVHPINLLSGAFLGSKYSLRSANAGACVAAYEPDKFLDVSAALFENQPSESTRGLTNGQLVDLVKEAGVTAPEVDGCINGGEFQGWVDAATERALLGPLPNTEEPRVTGTPTILVNGKRYQPTTSLADTAAFAAFVQSMLAATGDDADPTPTPTPTP